MRGGVTLSKMLETNNLERVDKQTEERREERRQGERERERIERIEKGERERGGDKEENKREISQVIINSQQQPLPPAGTAVLRPARQRDFPFAGTAAHSTHWPQSTSAKCSQESWRQWAELCHLQSDWLW